jgi:hypothetical protein
MRYSGGRILPVYPMPQSRKDPEQIESQGLYRVCNSFPNRDRSKLSQEPNRVPKVIQAEL